MLPQLNILLLFRSLRLFLLGVWERAVGVYPVLPKIVVIYKFGAYVFIIFGAIFAAVVALKVSAIKSKEQKILESSMIFDSLTDNTPAVNPRWQAILDKAKTESMTDWQWAIIEADKILDEMVMRMGYAGANLGERLKLVEVSDFLTLNEAWEAHKVRNQIAHEVGFTLDKRKTAETIKKFEQVFNEFGYI